MHKAAIFGLVFKHGQITAQELTKPQSNPEIQDYLVYIQSRGGGRGQGVTYVTFSKSKL